MGLGRFGIAGCCQCSPGGGGGGGGGDGGVGAGPCGWCGPCDGEQLEYPVPPEKECPLEVSDAFVYSKDYPRVPWWTWQQALSLEGDDMLDRWLLGNYHHLEDGHFCPSTKGRYRFATTNQQNAWFLTGKKVDVAGICKSGNEGQEPTNPRDRFSVWLPLTNFGPDARLDCLTPYTRKYENGVILNSQTPQTDLLPLEAFVSLNFNIPENEFPKYYMIDQYGPDPPGRRECFGLDGDLCPDWRLNGAYSYTGMNRIVHVNCAEFNQPLPPVGVFNWASSLGADRTHLYVQYFHLNSMNSAYVPNSEIGKQIHRLNPPDNQELIISYFIARNWLDGCQTYNDCQGQGSFYQPTNAYRSNFSLKIKAEFTNYPADNRKMFIKVMFLIDEVIVYQNTHLIWKPGWTRDSAPDSPQTHRQMFCATQVNAINTINGVNYSFSSLTPSGGGTTYEAALWDGNQKPRENVWIDNWHAKVTRL